MSLVESTARAMFEDEQAHLAACGHRCTRTWEDVNGPQFKAAVADQLRRYAHTAIEMLCGPVSASAV